MGDKDDKPRDVEPLNPYENPDPYDGDDPDMSDEVEQLREWAKEELPKIKMSPPPDKPTRDEEEPGHGA